MWKGGRKGREERREGAEQEGGKEGMDYRSWGNVALSLPGDI